MWGMATYVEKCGVLVFNAEPQDNKYSEFWADVEIPKVSTCTYLGHKFSKNCVWYADIQPFSWLRSEKVYGLT